MLTAAVRDLHGCYPGRFLTDVRTFCPDLWENNPHITPLNDEDPGVEKIECSYPLINRSNKAPYHCLHGFIEFLNNRLHLAIKPTQYKGDIRLSAQERAWYSQVQEITKMPIPFWVVATGGKYDLTIKWWEAERYQQVVDHFRGRIQFVQVGGWGHHHPKLAGTVDLRGQTSLRELVRLVYHSQGVLCPVTSLMHLAAAVPSHSGQPVNRPCVVVAGGREPAHWEAYPGHQYIHANSALPCCANGGCWRDRTFPLRDGDKRDRHDNLCVNIVRHLPRCMDMVSAEEVIRRIELYFDGGIIKYLGPRQQIAAQRGVFATRKNRYDDQPLTLHSAGMACDKVASAIPAYPDRFKGRGIVICAGGARYFTNAWVCINILRGLGCRTPIQVWYRGNQEMSPRMKGLLAPLGVEFVDAFKVRRRFPVRRLGGWELKPYAILHCPYREVLLLDADNVAVKNPEFLFDCPEYRSKGAVFWPDFKVKNNRKLRAIWRNCGLRQPGESEFETGQILVDKSRCWEALWLSMWFNEQSDFYYRYLHGDKETFHLAFRKLKASYALVPTPMLPLTATMCQHDFQGRRLFQHRNADKWDLFLRNKHIEDFWLEEDCRKYLGQLREKWDGGMELLKQHKRSVGRCRIPKTRPVKIEAMVIASRGSKESTLTNLVQTDWGNIFSRNTSTAQPEKVNTVRDLVHARIALLDSLKCGADYVLFLRDNLTFNRHLRHNLGRWVPIKTGNAGLASLYNPGTRDVICDLKKHTRIVDPHSLHGEPAFLISRDILKKMLRHWGELKTVDDVKISQLAAWLNNPVFYHAPSLAQQATEGVRGNRQSSRALDFDPLWRA